MRLQSTVAISMLLLGIVVTCRGFVAAQPIAPAASGDAAQSNAVSGNPGFAAWYRAVEEDEARVLQALDTKISVEFKETPLREALDEIAKRAAFSLRYDLKSIGEWNISLDDPISYAAFNLPAGDLLGEVLRSGMDNRVAYYCQAESVVICNLEEGEAHLSTRIYDVRPLLALGYRLLNDAPCELDFRGRPVSAANGLAFQGGPFAPTFGGGWPRHDGREPVPLRITGLYREWPARHPTELQAGQLVAAMNVPPYYPSIQELVGDFTEGPWLNIDGVGGTMDRFGTTLLIRHTDRVHREVVRILDVLERSAAAAPVFEPISIDRRLEAPILAALAVRVSADFDSTPILDALHDLWQQAGVEIGLASSVDGAAEDGDAARESVTLRRTSVPLGEVLSQIASDKQWSIRVEPGRLTLIPRQERDEDLWSAIYDLRDFLPQDRQLVINTLLSQSDGPWLETDGIGGSAQTLENGLLIVRQTLANHGQVAVWLDKLRRQGLQHEPAAAETADEEWSTRIYPVENADAIPWLVESVETFVRPETWDQAGGQGAIRGAGHSLIIRQTGAGHRDVAQLLLRIEQAHRYVSENTPQPKKTQDAAQDAAPADAAQPAARPVPSF